MDDQTYTSVECSRLAGATLRMLQNWDETDLLVPEMIAHSRQYSADQVLLARVFRWLRGAGITIAMLRRMKLRGLHEDHQFLVVSLGGRTPKWRTCLSVVDAIEAAAGATVPVVVVPLLGLRSVIAGKARRRAA